MASFYYVPLGPRGLILRVGTALLGLAGGVAYWHLSRRRALPARPRVEPIVLVVKR